MSCRHGYGGEGRFMALNVAVIPFSPSVLNIVR